MFIKILQKFLPSRLNGFTYLLKFEDFLPYMLIGTTRLFGSIEYISFHILRGYVYSLSNFSEATFIQGATSIPDSRVVSLFFEHIIQWSIINFANE